MLPFIKGLLTGMAFGWVLYKVGASRYSRVIGMVTLRDTKIMKFAFATIATASFIYGLAALFGVAEEYSLVPRVMSYTGPVHYIGGILFGITMGVVGFCPGTCMAKVGGGGGDKKFTGFAATLGLFAGVLVYNAIKNPLTDAGVIAQQALPITLHGLLGVSYGSLVMILGAVCALIAILVDRISNERFYKPAREEKSFIDMFRGEWSWQVSGIVAGVLIVLATFQGGYLGFSGAILAVVGWVAHLVGMPMEAVPRLNDDIYWRAALIIGVLPGAYVAKLVSIPSLAQVTKPVQKTFDVKAIVKYFIGGTTISLGAMLGGGCTTGAFLAAWPTLSVGSFAMSLTFFAVAVITAQVLYFTKVIKLDEAQNLGDRAYD